MLQYIVRRTIQALPVLFLISIVSFVLMLQAPGGPAAQFNQNPRISTAQIDQWLKSWCLVQQPTFFDTIREYLGWLGVWNCNTASLLSSHGLPNFLLN